MRLGIWVTCSLLKNSGATVSVQTKVSLKCSRLKLKKTLGDLAFSSAAANLWNDLLLHICSGDNFEHFKSAKCEAFVLPTSNGKKWKWCLFLRKWWKQTQPLFLYTKWDNGVSYQCYHTFTCGRSRCGQVVTCNCGHWWALEAPKRPLHQTFITSTYGELVQASSGLWSCCWSRLLSISVC